MIKGSDWTAKDIEKVWFEVERSADRLGLDYVTPQIEIVNDDFLINNYIYHGLPVYYPHWSFGKQYNALKDQYKSGKLNLPLETIINTDPAICYLSESNTLADQILVIAHAAIGHSNFFKHNYTFKDNTDPKLVIPILLSFNNMIREAEQIHGKSQVTCIIDMCHRLALTSFDRFKRPEDKTQEQLFTAYSKKAMDLEQSDPQGKLYLTTQTFNEYSNQFTYPEHNLLYWVEHHLLETDPWIINTVRTIRYIQQYFYPQYLTKMMNEGWATYVQKLILNDMYDHDVINDGILLETCACESAVTFQIPGFTGGGIDPFFNIHPRGIHPAYRGINPYKLGLEMYKDIYRISSKPDKQDLSLFKDICNTDPMETLKFAAYNFRDESFIAQYLSPKVIEKMKFATVFDHATAEEYTIDEIATEGDYDQIRKNLSNNYNINQFMPDIAITHVEHRSRDVYLSETPVNGIKIKRDSEMKSVLNAIYTLTGYTAKVL